MNKIKTIIFLVVIYALDMLVFKGPLISGLTIIMYLFLLIFYGIKKEKFKVKNFLTLLGLTFLINILTVVTGDFLNDKIKEISLISYNDAVINKKYDVKLNIYNSSVDIFAENNNYKIKLYSYNFRIFTYENNQWTEEEEHE